MLEFLSEYGLFLAKTLTVVVAVLACAAGVIALSLRGRGKSGERIEVKHLNRRYDDMALTLKAAMLPKKAFKQTLKARKKQRKQEPDTTKRHAFVLNFHGDIRATAVASLREEVTAVLKVAAAGDEAIVRLESGGGMVHAYGLAAAQLARLRAKGLKLTVAVDKIAASGGYMMAVIADRIIAAPFAVVGSIGVIAQLPNFNRLLKRNDIDYEQFMAGEYKRTVTLFGENTDKEREKFQQELEDTHDLFKEFVKQYRPQLDLTQVATGEHWYGVRALALGLIDDVRTSDDYLLAASADADLYEVSFAAKKPVLARLFAMVQHALGRADGHDAAVPRLIG